jgi:hypothetical protein
VATQLNNQVVRVVKRPGQKSLVLSVMPDKEEGALIAMREVRSRDEPIILTVSHLYHLMLSKRAGFSMAPRRRKLGGRG